MLGRELVFWEPSVSPHKLALVRALQRHPTVSRVRYVADRDISADRLAQGWQVGSTGDVPLNLSPSSAEIEAIFEGGGSRTIHLFSGLRHFRVLVEGLQAAHRYRARFLILHEPRASEGWRGLVRLAESWATEGPLRRNASAVLAIGRNGPAWFHLAGYPLDRIFPFGYFLPPPPLVEPRPRQGELIRLAYLGRITEPKGIMLLLEALPLLHSNVRVEVAGHGPKAQRVKAAAAAHPGRLTYHGPLPMDAVPQFLRGADILVQPSLTTDDGWAAVVSEALLAGVAVIATSKVGASILLDEPDRGRIMARPDARLLADAVAEIASGPLLGPSARIARRDWARARLTDEAGADYLIRILAHLFDGASRPDAFYV